MERTRRGVCTTVAREARHVWCKCVGILPGLESGELSSEISSANLNHSLACLFAESNAKADKCERQRGARRRHVHALPAACHSQLQAAQSLPQPTDGQIACVSRRPSRAAWFMDAHVKPNHQH